MPSGAHHEPRTPLVWVVRPSSSAWTSRAVAASGVAGAAVTAAGPMTCCATSVPVAPMARVVSAAAPMSFILSQSMVFRTPLLIAIAVVPAPAAAAAPEIVVSW